MVKWKELDAALLILITYKNFIVVAASLLNKKFLDLNSTCILISASKDFTVQDCNGNTNTTFSKTEAGNTLEMVF